MVLGVAEQLCHVLAGQIAGFGVLDLERTPRVDLLRHLDLGLFRNGRPVPHRQNEALVGPVHVPRTAAQLHDVLSHQAVKAAVLDLDAARHMLSEHRIRALLEPQLENWVRSGHRGSQVWSSAIYVSRNACKPCTLPL